MCSYQKFYIFIGMAALVFCYGGIQAQPLSQEDAASGGNSFDEYLTAQKVVILSAEVPGIIDHIYYQAGEFVKEGDVLIQLNTDLVNLRIQRLQDQIEMDTGSEESRINLEYRTSNLEIIQKLYDTVTDSGRVGSRKELEESKQLKQIAELGKTKAELNLRLLALELQENQKILDRHSIRAPFDGVVVPFVGVKQLESQNLKRMEQGEAVQAGQVVMTFMKLDRLRVQWELPVEGIDRLQLGQKARVIIQPYPDFDVSATVIYISPTVEITEAIKFEVEFDNPLVSADNSPRGFYRYRFRPGMRARVVLE